MTVQDAIKILNPETSSETLLEIEYYGGFNGNMAQIQAVIDASLVAVECMEKQIPKKPILYGDSEDGKLLCPNCNEDLWDIKECGFNGCPYCLQKLDWEEGGTSD